MERPVMGALFVALMVTSAACVIVDTDGIEGGDSSVGGEGTGNTVNTGGSGGDSSVGGSSNNTGGGGVGGGTPCTDFNDCPTPLNECMGASCEADGYCAEIPLPEGQLCSAGVCNGLGDCVECVDDNDCGAEEVCNLGTCETTILGGVCGDNFCQLLPATNDCFTCILDEGGAGGQCQTEYSDCVADGTSAGCTTCLEYFQGMGADNFCAGSADLINATLQCLCTPGVCAE